MKIVVIGGSRYSRASTIKKLQLKGHEVEAAPRRAGAETFITDYRDAGYAGQYLRHCLLHLGSLIYDLWRQRRSCCNKLSIRYWRFQLDTLRNQALRHGKVLGSAAEAATDSLRRSQ
ncbi:MAG: hypothetical protein E5W55_01320 [Mesorhizobium sp.]|nr:MAG: hypothetical protein E5W55_01320 [Mesorhizobium sp.]